MSDQTCYAVDGSKTEDIPCGFPSSNQCCGSGWDCLENGLCRQHGTTSFSQGTCTNINYDNCLSFCNADQFGGATEVSSCGINDWCCAGQAGLNNGGDCCDNTKNLQPFPYATILAGQVGPSGSVSGIATATSTSTSSKTTSTNPMTPSLGSAARLTQQPNTSAGGLSTTTQIAIGVAVPVGLLLVAVLVFFIYRNEKQGRRMKQLLSGNSDRKEVEEGGDDTSESKSYSFSPGPDGVEAGEPMYHAVTHQLDDTGVGELEGLNLRAELMHEETRYELDDTHR